MNNAVTQLMQQAKAIRQPCPIVTQSVGTSRNANIDKRRFDLSVHAQREQFQRFVSWAARNNHVVTIYPEGMDS